MSSIVNLVTNRHLKNIFINSEMKFAQRGVSFISPGDATKLLDRWQFGRNTTATHTITKDTDVPTFSEVLAAQSRGYIFTNSLRMALTLASGTVATNDYSLLYQRVEGHNFADLAQRQFTLSFWVKVEAIGVGTGVYCVGFTNGAGDKSFVGEYTVNQLNTWEYKKITVPPSPSSGTWNYTNGLGLVVYFTLAAGSAYQAIPGSWQNGNLFSTSNQTNGIQGGIISHKFTGMQITDGPTAVPFRPAGATIADELALCQRYFQKTYFMDDVPGTNIGNGRGELTARWPSSPPSDNELLAEWNFATRMRQVPVISIWSPQGTANQWRRDSGDFVAAQVHAGNTSEVRTAITNLVATNTAFHRVHGTADAEL